MTPSPTESPSAVHSTQRPRKRRITLSLPIAIGRKLKDLSDRGDRTYREVILEAYLEHAESIQARAREASSPFLGLGTIRRQGPQGRVQVALLIHTDDLGIIDGSAKRARLDRSGYVAELIALS